MGKHLFKHWSLQYHLKAINQCPWTIHPLITTAHSLQKDPGEQLQAAVELVITRYGRTANLRPSRLQHHSNSQTQTWYLFPTETHHQFYMHNLGIIPYMWECIKSPFLLLLLHQFTRSLKTHPFTHSPTHSSIT